MGIDMRNKTEKLKICFVALHKPLPAMIYNKNFESVSIPGLEWMEDTD